MALRKFAVAVSVAAAIGFADAISANKQGINEHNALSFADQQNKMMSSAQLRQTLAEEMYLGVTSSIALKDRLKKFIKNIASELLVAISAPVRDQCTALENELSKKGGSEDKKDEIDFDFLQVHEGEKSVNEKDVEALKKDARELGASFMENKNAFTDGLLDSIEDGLKGLIQLFTPKFSETAKKLFVTVCTKAREKVKQIQDRK